MFKTNDCSERFPQLQPTVFKSIAWRMTWRTRTPQQRSPSATYNAADAAPTHETRPQPSFFLRTFLWHHLAPISRCSSKTSWEAPKTTSSNYRRGFQRLTTRNSRMNWDFSVLECQQERDERSLERPRKRIKSSAIKRNKEHKLLFFISSM